MSFTFDFEFAQKTSALRLQTMVSYVTEDNSDGKEIFEGKAYIIRWAKNIYFPTRNFLSNVVGQNFRNQFNLVTKKHVSTLR